MTSYKKPPKKKRPKPKPKPKVNGAAAYRRWKERLHDPDQPAYEILSPAQYFARRVHESPPSSE